MMGAAHDKDRTEKQHKDTREITKWARRYAQHRAIPILIPLALVALLIVGFRIWAYLAALADRGRLMPGPWLVTVFVAPALVVLIWWTLWVLRSILRGRQPGASLIERSYRKEGSAALETAETKKRNLRRDRLSVLVLFVCLAVHIFLILGGYLPRSRNYILPLTAVYCIPFMIFLTISQWHKYGLSTILIIPLYAAHMILILAGVPVFVSGALSGQNAVLLMLGYGMLVALGSHIYSRYALRRLKKLAQLPPGVGRGEGELQDD